MKNPVFIYCLKNPTTGDVRYIGQTNNLKKRFREHLTKSSKHDNHLGRWLRSLKGEKPVLAVLHEVAENESWAEEERRYISCARAIGVDLVNATDGGEGFLGRVITPEQRAKASAIRKGMPLSPAQVAANTARRGRPPSPAQQAANIARRGVPKGPYSPERCAAISASKMGVRASPETRAAMSAARKGVPKKPRTPEHCAAIGASKKGIPQGPFSPERCAAMSAARKGVPKGPMPLEQRAKLSARNKGVPWSAKTRAAYERRKHEKKLIEKQAV